MTQTKNPAAGSGRALKIDDLGRSVDILNPTEIHPELQSEKLAARTIMRRFRVSYYHAMTICNLAGIGGSV